MTRIARTPRRHVGGGLIPEDTDGTPLCTYPVKSPLVDIPVDHRFCRARAVALYHLKRAARFAAGRPASCMARCPIHDFSTSAWEFLERWYRREVVDADLDARLARATAGKS